MLRAFVPPVELVDSGCVAVVVAVVVVAVAFFGGFELELEFGEGEDEDGANKGDFPSTPAKSVCDKCLKCYIYEAVSLTFTKCKNCGCALINHISSAKAEDEDDDEEDYCTEYGEYEDDGF